MVDKVLKDNKYTSKVCFSLEKESIKAKYLDYAARMYLLRTDHKSLVVKIESETGIKMKFVPCEYFWKKIILSCKVSEHIEDHKLLPFLHGHLYIEMYIRGM